MKNREPAGRADWPRVSADRPCPVCKKPDWCLVAPDGTAAICARTEGRRRCGDAGWLHRLDLPNPVTNMPRKKPTPPPDWPALARRYASALDPAGKARFAESLGLPADGLDALPLVGVRRDDEHADCVTFPEVDAVGTVVGILRRYPKGKGPKGKDGAIDDKRTILGGKRGLTIPDGWRGAPGPVFVVEGPTDAAALTAAGLSAVGRPSNHGGAKLLAALLADLPADRAVVVVGENDRRDDGGLWPGRAGAESVAKALSAALRRPVPVAFPPDGAKDVRDWLTHPDRGGTPWPARGAGLRGHLERAAEAVVRGDGPPEIVIDTDEYRVNAEAAAALAREPDVYQRGGLLVHVVEHAPEPDAESVVRRPAGAPVIRELVRPLLRERLTRSARWLEWRGAGENAQLVPAHPPEWCVGAVHARGDWPGVRRLDALVAHPVLLPDGSVLAANGYHPGCRLLACLPPGLAVAVPDRPTRADVAAAVAVLLDPLADFPFQSDAHRAALVAGLLTPLAWFLFDGPAPLFLIDKNVRGAGAGLLADVVALTVTGRRFTVMTYTNDREELRKRITTLALEGERLVLLDNLAGAVGNDTLDAALTADRWKDRVLGGNRGYDGPLQVVWFATGNNVQLHADTSRRVCHVRMETPDERPELKGGFRYADLRGHVRRSRGALLSAALTVLRGWVVAGRPTYGLPAWGSFEGWSGVVREAVVFAGLPDPGETREALQTAADRDAAAMADIVAGLAEMDPAGRGLTTAEVVTRLKETNPAPAWVADTRAAVEELCGRLDGRLLGYKFRHFARRNFGGRMIDKAGTDGTKTNRWAVLPAGATRRRPEPSPSSPASPGAAPEHPGDAGDEGDGSAPRGRLFDDYADQMLPD